MGYYVAVNDQGDAKCNEHQTNIKFNQPEPTCIDRGLGNDHPNEDTKKRNYFHEN